jgi:CBS domain-containing protein
MTERRPSLQRMPVENIMTKGVKTIEGNKLVEDCIKLMRDNDIGCVIVVEKETPVGIFTERDLLRRVAEDPGNLRRAMMDVMSRPLKAILPTATVWDAIGMMNDSRIRHLPVVDKEKLVGILSQRDVTRLIFSNKDLLLAGIGLEEMRRFMLGE